MPDFPRQAGDRRTCCQTFPAPICTAITGWSRGINDLVATFGVRTVHAAVDSSLHDQRGADSRPDRDGVEPLRAASRALPIFAQRGGIGVAANEAEALRWYRAAAEQNSVIDQYQVGFHHDMGIGTPEDDYEALAWYRARVLACTRIDPELEPALRRERPGTEGLQRLLQLQRERVRLLLAQEPLYEKQPTLQQTMLATRARLQQWQAAQEDAAVCGDTP